MRRSEPSALFVASALAAAPALSQGLTAPDRNLLSQQQSFVEQVERAFATIEVARLAGNCDAREEALGYQRERATRRNSLVSETQWNEWEARLNAEQQQPCPPPGMTRVRPPALSAPPPPPAQSQPSGDPQSPEDILDDASPTQDLSSGSGSLDRDRVQREADDATRGSDLQPEPGMTRSREGMTRVRPRPDPEPGMTRSRDGMTRLRGAPLDRTCARPPEPPEGMTRVRGQTRTRGEPQAHTRASLNRPDLGMTVVRPRPDGAPGRISAADQAELDRLRGEMEAARDAANRNDFNFWRGRYFEMLDALIQRESDAFANGRSDTSLLERLRGERAAAAAAEPDPDSVLARIRSEMDNAAGRGLAARYELAREAYLAELEAQVAAEADAFTDGRSDGTRLDRVTRERARVAATSPVLGSRLFSYQVAFGVGGGEATLTPTTIGVRRDGPSGQASENPAGVTPDQAAQSGAHAWWCARVFGVQARFYGSLFEAEAESAFTVPASSNSSSSSSGTRIDSGIVYGGLSPGNSSGIIAFFGLNGATRTELTRINIGGEIDVAATPVSRVYVVFDYFREDVSTTLSAAASGSSGSSSLQFSQTRQQDLTRNVVSLGLGGDVTLPFQLGRRGTARMVAGGDAGLSTIFQEMNSFERNTNNFTSSVDRDFTLRFNQSDSDIGFWARTQARVELDLSPVVTLYAGATARYDSRVGYIFNPFSGDQVFFDRRATELRSDRSTWSWSAGGGLIFRLGRR